MNAAPRLDNIAACVFDAYGTLFDVAAAAERCKAALGDKAEPLAQLWRAKQLSYTWLRSLMGRYADFWRVTGEALDQAMETLKLDNPILRSRLMELYMVLDAYPEVSATVARLKAMGLKLAILSNGSPTMLTSAVKSAGLFGQFDGIFSVDGLGVYKPDPRVYALAADRLAVPTANIAFLSSNGWDACGAASAGLKAIWVNRAAQAAERLPGEPVAVLTRLDQLPPLLGAHG